MSDVLTTIASETEGVERRITSAVVGIVQLCSANPLRYALGFNSNVAANFLVSTDPSTDGSHGFPVSAGPPELMTVKDWAVLVQKPWFVFAAGGALDITVWEVTFPNGA